MKIYFVFQQQQEQEKRKEEQTICAVRWGKRGQTYVRERERNIKVVVAEVQ